MHGGVGQVEEKVFLRLGVGLDELHCFLGVLAGDTPLTFILEKLGHFFITHQRMNPLAIGRGSAAHVVGVGDAKVAIKTLARRQKLTLIAQMPFTHTHGGVAQFLEVIGDRMFLGVKPIATGGKENAGHTHAWCVTAG